MRKTYAGSLLGLLSIGLTPVARAQVDSRPKPGDYVCIQKTVTVTQTTYFSDGTSTTIVLHYGAGLVCHVVP